MYKIVILAILSMSFLGCSGKSKYDLVEDKEAVKIKKELTAFEHKRAKKELSDWQ